MRRLTVSVESRHRSIMVASSREMWVSRNKGVVVRIKGRQSEGMFGQIVVHAAGKVVTFSQKSAEIEAISVPFAGNLRQDVLLVVIPECSAQLVVVHVRFLLAPAPQIGQLVGIDDPEFRETLLPLDHHASRRDLVEQFQ